jgi:hypothetical protein
VNAQHIFPIRIKAGSVRARRIGSIDLVKRVAGLAEEFITGIAVVEGLQGGSGQPPHPADASETGEFFE